MVVVGEGWWWWFGESGGCHSTGVRGPLTLIDANRQPTMDCLSSFRGGGGSSCVSLSWIDRKQEAVSRACFFWVGNGFVGSLQGGAARGILGCE